MPEISNLSSKKLSFWRNKKTLTLVIQYSFIAVAGGIFQSTFSLFAGIRLGLDAFTVGILLTLLGVYQIFIRSLIFNRLRNSIGDPYAVLLGLGGYIITYLLLGFVSQIWELIILLFFISFSGSISQGIVTGFTSRSVDNKNQGKIMGITSGIDNLSQIIGPIIGGILLTLTGNFPYAIVLSLLSVIPFIIGFQVLKFGYDNRKKAETEEIAPDVMSSELII